MLKEGDRKGDSLSRNMNVKKKLDSCVLIQTGGMSAI